MLVRRVVVASLPLWILAGQAGADGGKPRFRTEMQWVDPVADLAPDAVASYLADNHVAKLLYVNRCVGGCQLTPGENDSRTNTSSIVSTNATLTEFAGTQETFDAVIDCLKEVYGPYDVEITTTDPGTEVFHHEAMLAGTPDELGLAGGIGGIAPAACSPLNNVISFSFGNLTPSDVENLCWTVAQESAHSFGLPNHVFDCSDPMTYLDGCGRKFFRNKQLPCGEFMQRPCNCGVSGQNSHIELTAVFGPGEPPAPTEVTIVSPEPDSTVSGTLAVFFYLQNNRLVDHVDLYVNGTKYASQGGHGFDSRADDYNFGLPNLPDGYLDIEIKAYDDLGTEGVGTVTVLKGAPCTNADSCFEFQECSDGRCKYPPAAGLLGDECAYDQYCLEGKCVEHDGDRLCSTACNPTVAGSCAEGFVCVAEGGCFPEDSGGGCCAVTGPDRRGVGAFPLIGLGIAAVAVLSMRRRRRA